MNERKAPPGLAADVLQKIAVIGLATTLLAPTAFGQAPDAEGLADEMLDRPGGRGAWASLKNTINGSLLGGSRLKQDSKRTSS